MGTSPHLASGTHFCSLITFLLQIRLDILTPRRPKELTRDCVQQGHGHTALVTPQSPNQWFMAIIKRHSPKVYLRERERERGREREREEERYFYQKILEGTTVWIYPLANFLYSHFVTIENKSIFRISLIFIVDCNFFLNLFFFHNQDSQ